MAAGRQPLFLIFIQICEFKLFTAYFHLQIITQILFNFLHLECFLSMSHSIIHPLFTTLDSPPLPYRLSCSRFPSNHKRTNVKSTQEMQSDWNYYSVNTSLWVISEINWTLWTWNSIWHVQVQPSCERAYHNYTASPGHNVIGGCPEATIQWTFHLRSSLQRLREISFFKEIATVFACKS